jgi:type I restriction enzyme R subunit
MVVDRRDLLSQHKGDFGNSDARRSVLEAVNGADLVKLLKDPAISGQLITTVHRFAASGIISQRKDITILVDEAHRSQEGDLGRQMRDALPNATLIGLTGTPIATSSHNTFESFGCPADDKRVMHRYTAANSVKDGTTVRLELDRRKIVQGLNQSELDEAYEAYRKAEDLSSPDAEIVAKAVTKYNVLLKDPRRIAIIAKDIANDLTTTIIPAGYGAMVVVADREACVLYVEALRKHLNADQVTAVISSGGKDDPDEWAPYIRDSAAEAAVANAFRDPTNPLKVLVVTSKLLAGFDAPNALAMFIDKPMRDHTLFQAVTRVNRTYTTTLGVEKGYGVIIDYCGVTPAILEAFSKSPDDVKARVVMTPEQLVTQLKNSLTRAERVFGEDFDWSAPNPLHRAKTALASDGRLWRIFRQNVNRAELIFETIPTNKDALAERTRLKRLVAVLHSYGTSFAAKKDMLVLAHGQAVRDLILDNTGDPMRADMNIVTLTPARIKQLIGEPTDPVTQITELQSGDVLATIRERLKARLAGPHAADYDSIAAKLEAFAATKYVPTVDGVQAAAIDLVELAKQLKAVDDLVGEEWEELDVELTGWSRAPEPVLTPGQALEQILSEYSPKPLPVGLDDVAAVLDEIVDKLSYRKLRDDPAAQKQLRSTLVTETKRLGLLPTTKQAVNDFIDQLRDYVNIYLT